MDPEVVRANAPLILKRLIDPLATLLGVPLLVRQPATDPGWPNPGQEAHAILHREFRELGPCPQLERTGTIPLDGQPPERECPLGLTERRFALTVEEHVWGILDVGPYFTREADRAALAGRSKIADAALAQLPYLPLQQQAALLSLCSELVLLAGSAAKASVVKETFLANMRHELRTPLNGVMGMLSLVLQGELAPRQRQFLDLAMDASHQLLSLINDLLEMHRISTGRLLLAEEPFGLRRELAPLLGALAEDAARHGLAFNAAIDPDVPESLVGDAARVKQILLNLVQNAFKFTDQGSVSLQVSRSLAQSDADTTTLQFSVRDTGIGIAPSQQQHIFDRFTIGEDFLDKRRGKLGLGLAIANEIVGKMHGTMHLDSTPGLGSVFSFTAVFHHEPAVIAPFPLPRDHTGQGAVILFVEDEPISRLLVRRILENQGYTPIEADSDQAFLETLRQTPVDMALVDLQTPRLDALGLIRRIRAGDEPGVVADIPIVALTLLDAQATCQRTLGTSACVTKPVTRQELLTAVEHALSARPSTFSLKPQTV